MTTRGQEQGQPTSALLKTGSLRKLDAETPTWNVPDSILLDPTQLLTIGGTPSTDVMLHSPKLPSMLSQKHAAITFDADRQQWSVEDLQSLNGVYINSAKIDPATPVHLRLGDEICFGAMVPRNGLRYIFSRNENGTHILQRVRPQSGQKSDTDITPPHSPKAKRLCPEGSISTSVFCSSVSTPDTSTHVTTRELLISPQPNSGFPASLIRVRNATAKLPPKPLSTALPGTSSSVSLCISRTPTAEDELFRGIDSFRKDDALSKTVFEEAGTLSKTTTLTQERPGFLATTIQIQIQAAKEEMDKEKQKLLSNIKALKSELSAKEELLAETLAEKTRQVQKDKEGIMNSMQEEFTCVICQELFVNAYTIPCSHSFCELCIKEWMKSKRKKDCPICRKPITSQPVRSLALDNAIDKMVDKMDPSVREERQKLKESYSESLTKFHSVSVASRSSTNRQRRGSVMNTLAAGRIVVVHVGEGDSSADSDEDRESRWSSEESDSDDPGIRHSSFEEGVGQCWNCGRRGHWAWGCPY